MKVTKLQARLNSYYEASKDSLGKNSESLKAISKIAGNIGLSHIERAKRINNWANQLKDSLNYSEKTYIDQILRINANYVKTTSRTREIKNSYEVRENISSIRKDIRGSRLENNVEFNQELLPTETLKINNYKQNNQRDNRTNSYFKRARTDLVGGLVITGVAALMAASVFFANYLNKKSIKEAIKNTTTQLETNYEKIINDKDKEIAEQKTSIALAGRPDEEVRKEAREKAVEDTKTKLKTNYEENIKRINQEAKKQVAGLLKQKKDLEGRLIIAGSPDKEVRKKAIEGMVEGRRFDKLYSQFQKTSNDYEGLKVKHDNLSKKNENLREKYINLENKNSTSEAIIRELTEIVKEYVKEREKAHEELNKDEKVIVEDFVGPLPRQETLRVNKVAEDRMAMLKDANSISIVSNDSKDYSQIYEEMNFQRQQYLIDKPWDHPSRIDGKCKRLSKGGKHIESLINRIGWGTTVVNDAVEGPVRFISGLGGGIWGDGSRLIGNKNDGFDKGWKNGDQFGAYAMDGIFGGISKNSFDAYLLQLKIKEAIKVPYTMEDTKLGGHAKLGEIIVVDTLPWVWKNLFGGHHGHHEGPPKNFGGGRISEGPGGNSIISGGGSSGGVGGASGGVGGI